MNEKTLFAMLMGVAALAAITSVSFAAEVSGGGAASLYPQETNDPGPNFVGKLYPQEENDPGPRVVEKLYPQEENKPTPGFLGNLCPQETNDPLPNIVEIMGIHIPAPGR